MLKILIIVCLFITSLISAQDTTKVVKESKVKDFPFRIIEDVPVYPGCVGGKHLKKACFNRNMQLHVVRNFDISIIETLGLKPGKKRIYLQFKIDKDGSVTNIHARAPHPKLKEEAIRIAKLLPKLIPGKIKGKPVRVGYTLPITFNVEEDKSKPEVKK